MLRFEAGCIEVFLDAFFELSFAIEVSSCLHCRNSVGECVKSWGTAVEEDILSGTSGYFVIASHGTLKLNPCFSDEVLGVVLGAHQYFAVSDTLPVLFVDSRLRTCLDRSNIRRIRRIHHSS